jgi:hypothetical protein
MKIMAASLWGGFVFRSKTCRLQACLAGALLVAALFLNACSTLREANSTVKTGAGVPTPCFDGDWRGTIKTVAGAGDRRKCKFRIVIHGETALAYEQNHNQWKEIADNSFGDVRYKISQIGDLYVVTWVNQGIYYDWSEEQTYSLSYVNPTTVKIVQLRHVNNREKGKDGVPWFYVCTGTLTRTKP